MDDFNRTFEHVEVNPAKRLAISCALDPVEMPVIGRSLPAPCIQPGSLVTYAESDTLPNRACTPAVAK